MSQRFIQSHPARIESASRHSPILALTHKLAQAEKNAHMVISLHVLANAQANDYALFFSALQTLVTEKKTCLY